MSSRITHISCPSCAGTLGTETAGRLVECKYCGSHSVVETPGHVPQYFIEPIMKLVDARRVAQSLLTDRSISENLVAEARFHSARLYMVPFYEMSGKRIGTFTQTKVEREVKPIAAYNRNAGYYEDYSPTPKSRAPAKKSVDTKVIIADVLRSGPAVAIPDWGLDQVNFDSIRNELNSALKPFKRSAMERYGQVFDPKVKADDFVKGNLSAAGMKMSKDKTKVAEARIKTVYYPLWRVKFRYKGRLYGITVDGVTGGVLAARAPARDSGRIMWMLLTVGLVTIWFSKAVKLVMGLSIPWQQFVELSIRIGFYAIPFLLVALAIVLTIAAFGWDQFRYDKEIVFRGEQRIIESINRPPHTILDKLRDGVMKILDTAFTGAGVRWSRY